MEAPLPYRIFSGNPHSLFMAFRLRQSPVNAFAWYMGVFGCTLDLFCLVLQIVRQQCDYSSQPQPYWRTLSMGFQIPFPTPMIADTESRVHHNRFNLILPCHCGSVVPWNLWQLTAFLPCSVPVSAFAFRLGRLTPP